MILEEVREAPRALGLIGDHLVPQRDQLAQDAAKDVRVAVVPAAPERMGEIGDPHAATFKEAGASVA
jgi:hypothetical protein